MENKTQQKYEREKDTHLKLLYNGCINTIFD